ncbi:hypothetical protein ES703_98123 [subsurface metagenome]
MLAEKTGKAKKYFEDEYFSGVDKFLQKIFGVIIVPFAYVAVDNNFRLVLKFVYYVIICHFFFSFLKMDLSKLSP